MTGLPLGGAGGATPSATGARSTPSPGRSWRAWRPTRRASTRSSPRRAEGWTAERLAPLERNILRVAVHELLDWPDIPAAVSINEAVELAKRYCQTEAPGLVNGILGRIAAEQARGDAVTDPGRGRRALEAAAARLEEVARPPRRRRRAAARSCARWPRRRCALGAEITERLPRALRSAPREG